MIHQGTLVESEHAKKVKSEKIAVGNYAEIIHLHLRKGGEIAEHVSLTPAVLVIISGEMDFIANGKSYFLEKGDYITFEPHVPHSLKAYEDTHMLLMK